MCYKDYKYFETRPVAFKISANLRGRSRTPKNNYDEKLCNNS